MKIELLDGKMPERAHEGDAGLDIYSAEELTLQPGTTRMIRAGFKMQLDAGHEAQVRSRSGLAAKNQVIVLNSPGTIDTGYRGEVKVIMANLGPAPFEITRDTRIAQMVISKFETPTLVKGKVDETSRGEAGFGSTGK